MRSLPLAGARVHQSYAPEESERFVASQRCDRPDLRAGLDLLDDVRDRDLARAALQAHGEEARAALAGEVRDRAGQLDVRRLQVGGERRAQEEPQARPGPPRSRARPPSRRLPCRRGDRLTRVLPRPRGASRSRRRSPCQRRRRTSEIETATRARPRARVSRPARCRAADLRGSWGRVPPFRPTTRARGALSL